MTWFDKFVNKLSDMFACPSTYKEETKAQLPKPEQPVFSEAEVNGLVADIEKLNADIYDLTQKLDTAYFLLADLRDCGKFKKGDKELLDEVDKFINGRLTD